MRSVAKAIENAGLVENIFGGWPSFHDAEIHRILLERDGTDGVEMDVAIHHWQMTAETDSQGYFVLKHHTLTTIRFSGVTDLDLAGFNHQNVLWELEISESPDPSSNSRFTVSMPTSYGCEAGFKCRRISVLSAQPYSNS